MHHHEQGWQLIYPFACHPAVISPVECLQSHATFNIARARTARKATKPEKHRDRTAGEKTQGHLGPEQEGVKVVAWDLMRRLTSLLLILTPPDFEYTLNIRLGG